MHHQNLSNYRQKITHPLSNLKSCLFIQIKNFVTKIILIVCFNKVHTNGQLQNIHFKSNFRPIQMLSNFDSDSQENYFKQEYSVQFSEQFGLPIHQQSSCCRRLQVSQSQIWSFENIQEMNPQSNLRERINSLNGQIIDQNMLYQKNFCKQKSSKAIQEQKKLKKTTGKFKGWKSNLRQKQLLNKNINSQLLSFLKKELQILSYSQQQKNIIQIFIKQAKNINSLCQLFQQNQQIGLIFQRHYYSVNMVRNIMKSKMSFRKKIILINYISKGQPNILSNHFLNK